MMLQPSTCGLKDIWHETERNPADAGFPDKAYCHSAEYVLRNDGLVYIKGISIIEIECISQSNIEKMITLFW